MATPTIIRSHTSGSTLAQVITYSIGEKEEAVFQVYDTCNEYTVMVSSSHWRHASGAVIEFNDYINKAI